MSASAWPPSPARPTLADGAVHVWCADLAAGEAHTSLDAEERARAARFVREQDGCRWAAARGILRELLGCLTGEDPQALRFAEGPHGKPALAGAAQVRFNLSHSGDTALYAVALDREVGVDVELPRRAVDHVAIARRVLGDAEAQRLAGLDPPQREREFLRAWVRWEAALKCRGVGIGGAGEPSSSPDPWIRELPLDPPGAAALAVDHGPVAVRCWAWPPAG